MTYNYNEIANNFNLWQEYVDPQATMTETEFNSLSEDAKIQMQIDAFGEEVECAECEFLTNDPQDMHEHREETRHSGLKGEYKISSAHNQYYKVSH